MLSEIKRIISESPKPIEDSEDSDYLDVRLCIETEDSNYADAFTWIIRIGDSSYDQRHSPICGATSVNRDSNPVKVLEDLINQCCDQAAEIEES